MTDLASFVQAMTLEERHGVMYRVFEPWMIVVDPPFNDFNREIIEPNTFSVYPDGALGIRTDDDFWPVAALPYK